MKSSVNIPSRPPLYKRNASGVKPKNVVRNNSSKKQKNKSVEQIKKRRKVSIEVMTKFKISSDHMEFLIQEQKTSDLASIRSSVALNHYYESLLSLFSVIYSCSQIITSNIFQHRKMTTGLSGLKFVGVFFNIYEKVWNQVKLLKLQTMAKNVMKMGRTPKVFQQKIQFICRKVTLNFNMRKRIQMAFLNTKLDNFWQNILYKFNFSEQIQFLDDLYEYAPQKMAYWDFTYFVNNFISNEEFYETLKQCKRNCNRIQTNKLDTQPHNFTYQFFVIQIFCFHQQQIQRDQIQGIGSQSNKNCQLI